MDDLEFEFDENAYFDEDEFDVPGFYNPSESHIFSSILKLQRESERQAHLEAAKQTRIQQPVAKETVEYEKVSKEIDYEKDKEYALKIYYDYLKYRKFKDTESQKVYHTFDVRPTKRAPQYDKAISSAGAAIDRRKLRIDETDLKEDSFGPLAHALKPRQLFSPILSSSPKKRKEKEKPADESEKFSPELEYLVNDTYFPGVIDDAVNKKINYYQVAFDMSFGSDIPDQEPENMLPTLVEAFDMRYELENDARKQETITKYRHEPDEENVSKSFLAYLKGTKPQENVINRDEIHVANAVEFDLLNIVRNRPNNELIHAINSLFKAVALNNFDKSQQAAEEAFSRAPPELAESAAVYQAEIFQTHSHKKRKTHASSHHRKKKPYNPIEIVSYIGITKPNENPIIESKFAKI